MPRWFPWVLALAAGCGWYGTEPYSNVTRLRRANCARPGNAVALHFENDKPPGKQTIVGLVEVVGGSTSGEPELLARLKTKARKLGANAVVAVRKQFKTREQGLLNPLSSDDVQFTYGATVFTGVAVCLAPPPPPCAGEKRAARLQPFDIAALDELAGCQWKAGRYREMARSARTAVRDNPRYIRGYINLGRAERALGHTEAAVAAARRAEQVRQGRRPVSSVARGPGTGAAP